ncbi:MAG: hypothetical protein L3J79_11940 [Candidatus Marinimicrobia bacterium]|nr:hypothetical protein [Candidatus Neomarinimicrobiota bacterium]
MNIFKIGQKSRAFVTGCIVGTMSFGFTGQVLAQTAPGDPLQFPPTTTQELNDVMTVVNGGGDAQTAIEINPVPYREYGAWLEGLWVDVFASPWEIERSYLVFPELVEIPENHLWVGQSPQGESVSYYIEDIIDLAPTIENGASLEDLLVLEGLNGTLKIVMGSLYTGESSRNGILSLVLSGDAGSGSRVSVVFPLHDYEFSIFVNPGGDLLEGPPNPDSMDSGFGGVSNFNKELRENSDCEESQCVKDAKDQLERDLRDDYTNFKGGYNNGNIDSVAGGAAQVVGGVVGTGETLLAFLGGGALVVLGAFIVVGATAAKSKNNIDTYQEARYNHWDDFYDALRACGITPYGRFMQSWLHCYGPPA